MVTCRDGISYENVFNYIHTGVLLYAKFHRVFKLLVTRNLFVLQTFKTYQLKVFKYGVYIKI